MDAVSLPKRHMEGNLHLPLGQVLPLMQQRITTQTSYFGIPTLKSPIDFWVYQEIIHAVSPDVIIEIGNYMGGSALALAHLCDLIGKGIVVGCDLHQHHVSQLTRNHPRISLYEGDAVECYDKVVRHIRPTDTVLIIEDSSHTYDNTLAVLRKYYALVTPGSYFVVEDGICYHGLDLGPKPGPYEAIETFVAENRLFEVDRSKESFLITWNPKGYLRRKAS